MKFDLIEGVLILERTPRILTALLYDLPEVWAHTNEGGGTWSPLIVLGHLVHGEKTDWIPRLKIILEYGDKKPFEPFDRLAQLKQGKSIAELLSEFTTLRKNNLAYLRSLDFSQNQLNLQGIHPALGRVTLGQLLATWVVHDLNHLAQISRVMANQYYTEVGPWTKFIGILQS